MVRGELAEVERDDMGPQRLQDFRGEGSLRLPSTWRTDILRTVEEGAELTLAHRLLGGFGIGRVVTCGEIPTERLDHGVTRPRLLTEWSPLQRSRLFPDGDVLDGSVNRAKVL